MIIGFRHKGLEVFYLTGSTRGISVSHASKLARILAALDAAATPAELDLPSFKLHMLKGKAKAIGRFGSTETGASPFVSPETMLRWSTILTIIERLQT